MRLSRVVKPVVLVSTVVAGLTALVVGPAAVGSAAAGRVYYVSPTGIDSAAGTQAAPWATIAHAQSVVQAGDTVYFRGGAYNYTHSASSCRSQTDRVDAITLNKGGSAGNPIRYMAYPGERPIFDFSRVRDNCRIKGFDVTGSWIHLKGLEVTGAPQNNNLNHESWGIWVSGSNNTFEQLDLHHNMGPGLFLQDGGGNLVLDSDSHDNYDPHTSNGAGESADGFGAHISANHPGNVFRGCRAWWNSDDGFDLINAFSPVTIENSWAWLNGYLPGTTTASGNGNGFKAGGYGGKYVSNGVKHTVRSSVAFNNRSSGFYANHHTVADDFFNNTAYSNHPDFNMLGISSSGAAIGLGKLRNNIAYGGTLLSNMTGTNAANNSWDLGVTLPNAGFQSVSTSGWDAPRQSDGGLPVLPHLHLAPNSALIDKGVDVGLPYSGAAPDLGAFESPGRVAGGSSRHSG
ncbi:right-handed parallel beta-helix repeat-containing protein [Streptomyces rishiriensis]|uniref:right-handed parallel beta-helix repeat-containing protein n=1 Tax=Streptomyces rishiriensis TaxID=68264 RepID=UPI0037BCB1BC